MKSKYHSSHSLVITALFASLLCICAYITIPLPTGQHITLQNFMVLLTALLFPVGGSFFIVLVWLFLGIVGIPVFVGGNTGISYLWGPTGGYSVSFLIISVLLPLLRPKKYNRCIYSLLAVFAVLLTDVCGALQVMFLSGISLKTAVLLWFFPYLPADLIKAVIAAQVIPKFRQVLNASGSSFIHYKRL